jgi:hypothetical protein
MAIFGIPTKRDFNEVTEWLAPAEAAYNGLVNTWPSLDLMPVEALREFIQAGEVVAQGEEELARMFTKTGQGGDAYEMQTGLRETQRNLDTARELLSERMRYAPQPPPDYQYPQQHQQAAPPPAPPPPAATRTDDPNDDWS